MVFNIVIVVAFTLTALLSLWALKYKYLNVYDRFFAWMYFTGSTIIVIGNFVKII